MQPMSFGSIYSYTFWLIRQTIGPTIVAIVTLAIFAVLMSYGFSSSFHSLTELVRSLPPDMQSGTMDQATQERIGRAFLSWIVPVFATGLMLFLAARFTQILVTNAGWDAATGDKRSIGELAGASLGRPFWMSLAQTIIVSLLWFAVSIVFGIIMGAMGGATGSSAASDIIGYVLQGLQVWFAIATVTAITMITVEGRGPWKSLVASLALGKGMWWRNFALFLIPGIVVIGIAVVLLIVSMQNGSAGLVAALQTPSDPENPVLMMEKLQAVMGYIAPIITVMMVLGAVIYPFFQHLTTAIYIDLRARRGDFDVDDEDEEEAEPGDTTIRW